MNKHTATSDATRKSLVDAFCTIYKDKPIEKITIQEITSKAGYNRGTFYQYFHDVHMLLTYIEDMVISYIQDNIVKNIRRDDISDTYIKSLTNIPEEQDFYMKALLSNVECAKFNERLKAKMLPLYMEQLSISERDKKSMYVLDFYLSGLNALANRWFNEDKDIPAEELALLIHSLLAEGVLATLDKDCV